MFGSAKYSFVHKIGIRETNQLRGETLDKGNDKLAEYMALIYARRLRHDGTTEGIVEVNGPKGFCHYVTVATALEETHPLEKLSTTPISGWQDVFDDIEALWPHDGTHAVKANMLAFNVWGEHVEVKIYVPRGPALDLTYNGIVLKYGLVGPSVYDLVAWWEVSEQDAAAIWQEVCAGVRIVKNMHLQNQ